MKTVSGKAVSTQPISISKAAKVLSKFVASETGASQAVSAYLKRASESFIELVQFHKDLKAPRSEKRIKESAVDGNLAILYQNAEEDEVGRNCEDSVGSDQLKRERKKKRKGTEDAESGSNVGIEVETSKGKKKRKHVEIDDGEVIDSGEHGSSKKKKKKSKVEGHL